MRSLLFTQTHIYIYMYMYNIIIVIFHININIHPQTILYMYTNFPDNLHSEVVIIYQDNHIYPLVN